MSTVFNLEWRQLNYSVSSKEVSNYTFWKNFRKSEQLKILKNVSGQIQSGDLVAILGPSGAGKTTLLAAISQRLRGNLSGEIFLNGKHIDRKPMTNMSSFLPQLGLQVQTFTAFEHLYFMSHFKMHKKTTKKQKIQKIVELLRTVGLLEIKNTRIEQLSGGERKRLNLAEELMTDPLFIFCDEPTTGLDSYSAYNVIKTLSNFSNNHKTKKRETTGTTATEDSVSIDMLKKSYLLNEGNRGKAIICSIHQPTSDIFGLFTKILLMRNGEVVFYGSTKECFELFSRLEFSIPTTCNPADFYLKTLTNTNHSEKLLKAYDNKSYVMNQTSWLYPKKFRTDPIKLYNYRQKIGWIYQVYLLTKRFIVEEKRNLKHTIVPTLLFLITSVTLSILFANGSELSQTSVQDVSGFLYMLSNEIIFTFSYAIIYEFPAALPMLRREVGEGTYNLSAYFVAHFLSLIPNAFFKSYTFLAIVYIFVLRSYGILIFLKMGFILGLSAVAANGYGIFLSSFFETDRMASDCAAPFDILFSIFGGVYYNVDSIPLMKYISLFFYTNEGLMYTFWTEVDQIACPTNIDQPCLENGIAVLKKSSFRTAGDTFFVDCLGLVGVTLVFNLISFMFIRKYVHRFGYY